MQSSNAPTTTGAPELGSTSARNPQHDTLRRPSLGEGHRQSTDSALEAIHQHKHDHMHHGHLAKPADPAYTKDGEFDVDHVPHQDHMHSRASLEMEMGKNGKVPVMDEEKGSRPGSGSIHDDHSHHSSEHKHGPVGRFYIRFRWLFHVAIFLLFTGWWIAGLVLHRYDIGWVVPFLLWLAITIRLVTFHVPAKYVLTGMNFVWSRTAVPIVHMIPEKFRLWLGAAITVAVFIIGGFASEETTNNTRANRAVSMFGLIVFIAFFYATSRNRKAINWHTVIVGMLVQFIVALFVLRTKAGFDIFEFISGLARSLLHFAAAGVTFLFSEDIAALPYFFVAVLPAIIFFVSLVQLLYYWGVLQWFIGKFAVFFFWSMRVSGAEAVVAAASPFIGQGESAMLIRPFVSHLTMAELHQIMCSGFATIAGSVLVAYISFGLNPQALISSCVMSIPASLAISKLRFPETEETLTAGRVVIPDDDEHDSANALHAFANGAWLGLKIAGMIAATLLCILALLALVDGLLTWWGKFLNINDPPLTIELVVGYLCYPIAFLLGVPRVNNDLYKVAQLIGTKLIANEFVAYIRLTTDPYYADLQPRSILIVTYALCGFANIGSLGTQIGVLSQIAPNRGGDVSKVALSAMLSGAIATMTSASIAGMIVTDQRSLIPQEPSRFRFF